MFIPPIFAETDPEVIAAMIAEARLCVLVTHGEDGLTATHLPIVHDAARGVLVGHIARANPQWRTARGDGLLIIPGPEAYVSPNWYPSKAVDGRQVPTWNYEAVHVTGALTWFEDPERLTAQLEQLAARFEAAEPNPWTLDEAPPDYTGRLLAGITGVEIAMTRVEAKKKLSQNKPAADRRGVIDALARSSDPRDQIVAARMQS